MKEFFQRWLRLESFSYGQGAIQSFIIETHYCDENWWKIWGKVGEKFKEIKNKVFSYINHISSDFKWFWTLSIGTNNPSKQWKYEKNEKLNFPWKLWNLLFIYLSWFWVSLHHPIDFFFIFHFSTQFQLPQLDWMRRFMMKIEVSEHNLWNKWNKWEKYYGIINKYHKKKNFWFLNCGKSFSLFKFLFKSQRNSFFLEFSQNIKNNKFFACPEEISKMIAVEHNTTQHKKNI